MSLKNHIQDIYALTPMQEGMLFHALLSEDSSTYFKQRSYRVTGDVDIALVEKSLQELTKRHEILRTAFVHENQDHPLQVVLKERKADFHYRELGDLSPAAENRALEDYRLADRARAFDLVHQPLMRFAVLKLRDREYAFIWSHHHLLMDGWCTNVLIQEYFQIYHALRRGKPAGLARTFPFRNYILWLDKQDKAASGRYWSDYLRGYAEPAALPRTGSPAGRPYDKGELTFDLTERETAQLGAVAVRHRVTPNSVFQALWGVFLGKYNGRNDVVFGSVVSGRPKDVPGIERMIGLFINTVPVRVTFGDADRFSAVTAGLQRQALASEPYHYLSLATIQANAPLKQHLLDHILIFENFPTAIGDGTEADDAGTQGLAVTEEDIFEQSHYDLNVVVFPGEAMRVMFQFNRHAYADATLAEAWRCFKHLLDQVLADPEASVGQLQLLTEDQKRQLLVDFNATAVTYPGASVLAAFEAQAAAHPAAVALVCGDAQLTYGQLDGEANAVARVLAGPYGVQPGDCVALMGSRSEESIIALLGIMKAGGVFLPVDSAYPAARIEYILADAAVKLVLTSASEGAALPATGDRPAVPVSWLRARNGEAATTPGVPNGPADLAYILYTSGSTGNPKGVEIGHRSFANYIRWSNAHYFGDRPGYCFCLFTSLSFDLTITCIFTTLLRGDRLHIYGDADVNDILLDVFSPDTPINTVKLTPSHINLLGLLPLERTNVSSVIVGGEALTTAQVKTLERLNPGVKVYNEYGPTETTVGCVVKQVTGADPFITIGTPIANTRIYILDPNGQLLPPGVTGEICIGGAGVARGYRNKQEMTARKFIADPFGAPGERIYRSGDLGRWLPDGSLLYEGRNDDQVKIRGYRIELGEIEQALSGHGAIKNPLVTARKYGDVSQLVVYYQGDGEVDENELRRYLKGCLPEFMVPSLYVKIDRIPLTVNGKVDHRALPDPAGGQAAPGDGALPANRREAKIREIWQQVMQRDNLPLDRNVFDLGAHSIHAVQVISRIQREFGVKLKVKKIFEAPTVQELARAVAGAAAERGGAVTPLGPQADYEVSHAQKRMWILEQMQEKGLTYVISGAYTIRGALDRAAFERAFAALVERHETLRTTFVKTAGELRQQVTPATESAFAVGYRDLRDHPGAAEAARERVRQEAATGFDLENGPLIRVNLLRTGDETYVYTVALHHIIADGWSVEVLQQELLALYAAFAAGRPNPLPPLAVQYKDYAAWQQGQLTGPALQAHQAYWLGHLAGELPVLNLPTDFPRTANRRSRGRTAEFVIGRELTDRLRAAGRAQNAGLFVPLLGCLNVLLYRYSGQRDIVVGTDVAGRVHRDLEGQVGLFLNTLALRTQVDSEESFAALLRRVRDNFWEAQEYQLYPLDRLITDLGVGHDKSRRPLFDVFMLLQNPAESDVEGGIPGGLHLENHSLPNPTAKFDLTFVFKETAEGLRLSLEYDTDLFRPATIDHWFGNLVHVMEQATADPHGPVTGIKLGQTEEELAFESLMHSF